MRFTIPLACLATLAAPVAHAAAEDDADDRSVVLKGASDWRLREYPDKCRVVRDFGGGEDEASLWIEQGSLTPAYNLTLIGKPFRHPFGASISVKFAPEAGYSRNYIYAESSKGRPVVTLFGARLVPTPDEAIPDEDAPKQDDGGEEEVAYDAGKVSTFPEISNWQEALPPERLDAITELRLGRALIKPVTLRTGPLAAPLAKLQDCARRLTETIAANTAEARAAGTEVKPVDVERWAGIIQQNYPREQLLKGEEGRIGVALTIGANGRPSHCEVTDVVGTTSFNDTVCLLMLRHATFEAARNAAGEPVTTRYRTRVTFRIN